VAGLAGKEKNHLARALIARIADGPVALLLPQPYSEPALTELALRNPQYFIEQSSKGNLTLSPPTAASGNEGELELAIQVRAWNRVTRFGKVGAMTAGIRLPAGGDYIPDVYVVPQHVWDAAPTKDRAGAGYVSVLPVALFELLSPGNRTAKGFTAEFQDKLDDYERSLVPLVVLLDPKPQTTTMRRPGREPQTTKATRVTFDELPGLELDVAAIFAEMR
jgi:Uma2 family endonuclease